MFTPVELAVYSFTISALLVLANHIVDEFMFPTTQKNRRIALTLLYATSIGAVASVVACAFFLVWSFKYVSGH